jgi:hypothetical protein
LPASRRAILLSLAQMPIMFYNATVLLFSGCRPAASAATGTRSFSAASKRNHRKLQIQSRRSLASHFIFYGTLPECQLQD